MVHGKSNENGQILSQFSERNRMKIKRTCFPNKTMCLRTWRSPDNQTVNQIDNTLINARHPSSVTDVRSYRAPGCYTHDYLVKIKLRGN